MSSKVIIKLPPYGTTARLLVQDFLIFLIRKNGSKPPTVSIALKRDSVEFSGPLDVICDWINGELQRLGDWLDQKLQAKFGDIPLHVNDRKFFKSLGITIPSKAKFGQVVVNTLKSVNIQPQQLSEFSNTSISVSRTSSTIILGTRQNARFSMFQPLFYERYESGFRFMQGRFGRGRFSLKFSIPWGYLLLAGFAISYAGYRDQEMFLLHAPEDALPMFSELVKLKMYYKLSSIEELAKVAFDMISVIEKYFMNVGLISPRLSSAYYLLFASVLAQQLGKTFDAPLILLFDRIMVSGRTFSLISREVLELSSLVNKMIKLKKSTLKEIQRVSRRALIPGFSGREYSIYANTCSKLFLALSGSLPVTDAAYYYARVLGEYELSQLKDLEQINRKKSIISSVVRDLLQLISCR